jgi:hypothetical protein
MLIREAQNFALSQANNPVLLLDLIPYVSLKQDVARKHWLTVQMKANQISLNESLARMNAQIETN